MSAAVSTGALVRVMRVGISRVLSLPAAFVRSRRVELGDMFTVQFVGDDDVIGHRVRDASVLAHGTGPDRYGVVADDEVIAAPAQRSGIRPLDWDF